MSNERPSQSTSMCEGRLLVVDGVPMTEAAAEAVGRVWLAEDPKRPSPLVVAYRDVEGKRAYEWVDRGVLGDA